MLTTDNITKIYDTISSIPGMNETVNIDLQVLFCDDYFPMFGSPFRKVVDDGHQIFAVFCQFVLDSDRLCIQNGTLEEQVHFHILQLAAQHLS